MAVVAAGAISKRGDPAGQPRLLAWLGYLVDGYAASLLGSVKYLCGQRITYWQQSWGAQAGDRFDICWRSGAGGQRSQQPGE